MDRGMNDIDEKIKEAIKIAVLANTNVELTAGQAEILLARLDNYDNLWWEKFNLQNQLEQDTQHYKERVADLEERFTTELAIRNSHIANLEAGSAKLEEITEQFHNGHAAYELGHDIDERVVGDPFRIGYAWAAYYDQVQRIANLERENTALRKAILDDQELWRTERNFQSEIIKELRTRLSVMEKSNG